MKPLSALLLISFQMASAQQPDSLQTLLAEVHQLRLDIEGALVASQRVQIALYQVQTQDAAVVRATQRLDQAHGRCVALEQARQQMAADLQAADRNLNDGTVPPGEMNAVRSMIAQRKVQVDQRTIELGACQATEAEAGSQLKNEQAKLTDLRDRIDRLDKALAAYSGK